MRLGCAARSGARLCKSIADQFVVDASEEPREKLAPAIVVCGHTVRRSGFSTALAFTAQRLATAFEFGFVVSPSLIVREAVELPLLLGY